MILAHHLLASLRTNADPEETLRRFYTTVIATIDGIAYTAGHFLGGYYLLENRINCHPNWINVRFEKIFNPVIGRALIQRPTLAKTRLSSPVYTDVDPYELLPGYSEENVEIILDILNDVSSFISKKLPSSKKLGQFIGDPSGVNKLYHSIWSNTLPTWHQLQPAPVTTPQDTRVITDKSYATTLRLYKSAPNFKSTLTLPPMILTKPCISSVHYPMTEKILSGHMNHLTNKHMSLPMFSGFNHTSRIPVLLIIQ